MAKKKLSKASKRSLILFGSISLVVIGYFFYNLMFYTYNIYSLMMEQKSLNESLNNLEHDEKILKTEIEKLKDSDYIARYARETYQYSKEGEIILDIKSETKQKESNNKFEFEYESILKIGGLFLFIIILYVILKNHKKNTNKKK